MAGAYETFTDTYIRNMLILRNIIRWNEGVSNEIDDTVSAQDIEKNITIQKQDKEGGKHKKCQNKFKEKSGHKRTILDNNSVSQEDFVGFDKVVEEVYNFCDNYDTQDCTFW